MEDLRGFNRKVINLSCPKCGENIESEILQVTTDLLNSEIYKFVGMKSTSYNDLLDLHRILKKKPIWKLLQQKEKNSENKQKA